MPLNTVAGYFPLIDLEVIPRRPLPAGALSRPGAVALVAQYQALAAGAAVNNAQAQAVLAVARN